MFRGKASSNTFSHVLYTRECTCFFVVVVLCFIIIFLLLSAISIGNVWIDGTDTASENTFRSSATGLLLSYMNWASGEPNNWDGGQHCVNLLPDTGAWDDLECEAFLPSVCEIQRRCCVFETVFLNKHSYVARKNKVTDNLVKMD